MTTSISDKSRYCVDMENVKQQPLEEVVTTVMAESSNANITALTSINENYACLPARYDENDTPAKKLVRMRKYQLHAKTYSPKWEQDPSYQGWVQRSKKGDGFYYCLACNQDYTCGKSELDKHASSRKHCMNLMTMAKGCNEQYSLPYETTTYEVQTIKSCDSFDGNTNIGTNQDFETSTSSNQVIVEESNEEVFGRFIINELKRIKNRKTYEVVKGEILLALQKAILKEVETEHFET